MRLSKSVGSDYVEWSWEVTCYYFILSSHSADDGMWAMTVRCDSVWDSFYFNWSSGRLYPDNTCWLSGCIVEWMHYEGCSDVCVLPTTFALPWIGEVETSFAFPWGGPDRRTIIMRILRGIRMMMVRLITRVTCHCEVRATCFPKGEVPTSRNC